MQRLLVRTSALTLWVVLLFGFSSSTALAQYKLTNLTSNQPGKANHQDPLLQNAWGLAYGPNNPFWVSDEWNGWSTLYNGAGVCPAEPEGDHSSSQRRRAGLADWYRVQRFD